MDLRLTYFQFPGLKNVRCLFQGRSRGEAGPFAGNFSFQTGDDPENARQVRSELAELLADQGVKSWSECRQIHGDNLLVDPAPTDFFANPATLPQADGMMTSARGNALIIKTADCQPILLASGDGCEIMALHVGWRGNRNNFPQKAVARFCEAFGVAPHELFAVRGPSLGPNHSRFSDFEKEWGADFLEWYDPGSRCVNLWNLTDWQLREAGLLPERIYRLDICTYDNFQDYFSYRRQHLTGRQAAMIWIARET